MNILYKNIIGNKQVSFYTNVNPLNTLNEITVLDKLSLCNVHVSDKVLVDLYLTRTEISTKESRTYVGEDQNFNPLKTTKVKFYIIKNLCIPVGSTLILEKEDILIDYNNYDFYIKLNNEDSSVDLLIYESEEKITLNSIPYAKRYK
jgi:hypothetical protein